MATLKLRLPSKVYDLIERAGICTTKQILVSSSWDIKNQTNLNLDDIQLLKNIAADCCSPISETAKTLKTLNNINVLSSSIASVDSIIGGGFRCGTLTELYGESGSGKTQLALQTAAHNWDKGIVYICTEDIFPVKRFNQMTKALPDFSVNNDYGSSVYVEHITESDELLSCIRVRLPKLLETNKIALVVLDSVAAPFRTDSTNYVQRAEDLRELAMSLIRIAQQQNIAVLCINQVTSSFDEGSEINVIPSLGLAWSNMIFTRLWIKKTLRHIRANLSKDILEDVSVREVCAVFSPNQPHSISEVAVTSKGVQSI